MLQGDFFHIKTLQTVGNTVKVLLEINPAHAIFEGHFPGQPVVPGVCLMQMVKEIAEKVLGKETRLVKADQVKFLAPLVPAENQPLQMELKFRARENPTSINSECETEVDAQLVNETTVFFKFKGLFA
jgi:3-hydroxyacyl-[acyl-carrier-protein] dehydratase